MCNKSCGTEIAEISKATLQKIGLALLIISRSWKYLFLFFDAAKFWCGQNFAHRFEALYARGFASRRPENFLTCFRRDKRASVGF